MYLVTSQSGQKLSTLYSDFARSSCSRSSQIPRLRESVGMQCASVLPARGGIRRHQRQLQFC